MSSLRNNCGFILVPCQRILENMSQPDANCQILVLS